VESVLLIACGNGLGHARRLVNIGVQWSEEVVIKIAMTEKQYGLLKNEIKTLSPNRQKFKVIIIPPIGLQGPENQYLSLHYNLAPTNVLSELESADMVISDNGLWPWFYRNDCIFMGHFTWVDYYLAQIADNRELSDLYLNFLKIEKNLQMQVRKTLIFQDFLFGKINSSPQNFPLKLPKYRDFNHGAQIISKTAHIAVGKTGIENIDFNKFFRNFPGWEIKVQETYYLGKSQHLPELIIGRPGLGTLRDCIQFNLKFYPIGHNDPELENNMNVILNNSIIDLETGIYRDLNPLLLGNFPPYSRISTHFK
jgi:hypothetical protein